LSDFDAVFSPPAEDALPLWLIAQNELATTLSLLPTEAQQWLQAQQFQGEKGRLLVWPDTVGRPAGAALGLGLGNPESVSIWDGAGLVERLPAGAWRSGRALGSPAEYALTLGFGLGSYRFERFRRAPSTAPRRPRWQPPASVARQEVEATLAALHCARDLINLPANELGPLELGDAIEQVAGQFGAQCERVRGPALAQGWPLVAAVGQGSARPPELIDLRWGQGDAPLVTLVGKGVCFDSGGLDLKPSAGMLLMKKDMAGAACALAVAQTLMQMNAPIRLRLLVAAVENSVGPRAYRPGDVLRSRAGLSVEIGNTDAEGRLVLADALAFAAEERPQLLIDFATLTGAARTALGPELPAVFASHSATQTALAAAAAETQDPSWPLPLWAGYADDLSSKIADLGNVASHGFAGAIIGALFLQRFVPNTIDWLHFDIYGWNARERPGRPVGAEPQCVRAVVRLIRSRFG
jgi:leucyl aminopeptidase